MKSSATIKGFVLFITIMLGISMLAGCGGSSSKTESGLIVDSSKKASDAAGKEFKNKGDKNAALVTKAPKLPESTSTTTSASTSETTVATTTTTTLKKAAKTNKIKKQYAVIETNKGKIVFEFYPDKAPNTVANFIKLAKSGFYNGDKWHRVVPGFVIQGGDPLSKDADPSNDGSGGPGYTIKAEFNDMKHLVGTVAMARSQDPDSAGSQFYICLAPQPSLDGQYTVFGQVTDGMDVVNKIQVGDLMQKVSIITK